MSLMQYLYSRLLDQMLEKLSDMKMVKLPWLVDNYSFIKFMGIAQRAKNGQPLNQPLGSTLISKISRELMFVPSMFPTPMARKLIPGWLSGKCQETDDPASAVYDCRDGLWCLSQPSGKNRNGPGFCNDRNGCIPENRDSCRKNGYCKTLCSTV